MSEYGAGGDPAQPSPTGPTTNVTLHPGANTVTATASAGSTPLTDTVTWTLS